MTDDVWIALLRGVNVGGHGKLPMADFRRILHELGARDAETYIQSGNAVFRGHVDADDIASAIEAEMGFRPRCVVLSASEFKQAIADNPFSRAGLDPKELHFFFCDGQPGTDPATLEADANCVERWHLGRRVLYLRSPGGLSKSKLADKLDRRLGVATTARNWNTVARLAAMAGI